MNTTRIFVCVATFFCGILFRGIRQTNYHLDLHVAYESFMRAMVTLTALRQATASFWNWTTHFVVGSFFSFLQCSLNKPAVQVCWCGVCEGERVVCLNDIIKYAEIKDCRCVGHELLHLALHTAKNWITLDTCFQWECNQGALTSYNVAIKVLSTFAQHLLDYWKLKKKEKNKSIDFWIIVKKYSGSNWFFLSLILFFMPVYRSNSNGHKKTFCYKEF